MNTELQINGESIKRVEYTKFLGIILDSNMTWSEHIKHIKSKISKGIGILCRARKVFNESTLKILYQSLIYPYLSYCIEVWGAANNVYISSLHHHQKPD